MKHRRFIVSFQIKKNKTKRTNKNRKPSPAVKWWFAEKSLRDEFMRAYNRMKWHNNSTKTTFACCLPFIIITLLQFKRQSMEFGWFTWIRVDSRLFTSNRLTIFQCIRINGSTFEWAFFVHIQSNEHNPWNAAAELFAWEWNLQS